MKYAFFSGDWEFLVCNIKELEVIMLLKCYKFYCVENVYSVFFKNCKVVLGRVVSQLVFRVIFFNVGFCNKENEEIVFVYVLFVLNKILKMVVINK